MFFNRTFHPDEANQAFTTGKLLETHTYHYNPADHHGPVLYYAAAPIQKFAGAASISDLDGNALRATPMSFSLLTILLGFITIMKIAKKGIFPWALFFVFFLLTTPIFAFFSSFFIQETLFGAFLFLMFLATVLYVNAVKKTSSCKMPKLYSILFGIGAGLAFATKETSCIAFLAFAVSGIIVLKPKGIAKHWNTTHFLFALFSGLLTSVLFFSSFGTHFQGVYDAFITMPANYFNRAAGDASSDGAAAHIHEWWWYLKLLFTPELANRSLTIQNLTTIPWPLPLQRALTSGWRFTELPLLICALLPLFLSFNIRRQLAHMKDTSLLDSVKWHKFFLLFTLIQLIIYSMIPYKTPWCMLTVVESLVLSAALSFHVVFSLFIANMNDSQLKTRLRLILAFILLIMLPVAMQGRMHLRGLEYMKKVPDASAIPYNYANASHDVKNLAKSVLAEMKNADMNDYAAVILPRDSVWPLPWYLRSISKRTGYWTTIDELKPMATQLKPKIIVVSVDDADATAKALPGMKQGGIFAIRPGVLVTILTH